MYFIVFGTDKPGKEALRASVRPSHRQYLANPGRHPVKVLLGGPTLDASQEKMNGTLLVVEAGDMAAVESFVRDDPYSDAALFESVVIRPWSWTLGTPGGGQ